MSSILILYSTIDGHTRDICLRLKQVIEEEGHRVILVSMKDDPNVDLRAFDKIVIGASIRYGKHRPYVADFIRRNQKILESKPSALFSVNVVARKPGKNRPDTNPYLRKFLKQIRWIPKNLAVFAGKINYPQCNAFDRTMIRLIMWITRGPTDPGAVVEFTDWNKVKDFGKTISKM